jgi:hypothetical protein
VFAVIRLMIYIHLIRDVDPNTISLSKLLHSVDITASRRYFLYNRLYLHQ